MSFTPLLVLFLQTGGLLLISLVVLRATRRAPAVRLTTGRITLLAVFGLIVLSPWTRQRPQPIVPIRWNPVSSEIVSTSQAPKAAAFHSAARSEQAPATSSTQSAPRVFSEDSLVQFVWLLGCAISGGFLGFGYWAVFRTRRGSQPVTDTDTLAILKEAASHARIKVPSLVISEAVAGPVVAGVLRPTIFLPAGLLNSAKPDEMSAVLRHEVAHIANGDLKWALFNRLLCLVAWPQPLVWFLARPMAAASEELCDSHVLASGIPAASYADALLRLCEGLGARRTLALGIGVASRNRGIATRIETILARKPKRTRIARPAALLMSATAAFATIGVTVVFAVPRQATYDHKFNRFVRVLGPDGRPVANAEAWLQLTGVLMEFHKLDVTAGGVTVSADNLPIHTAGTLVVHVPGLGLGITRLWPNDNPATELLLSKPAQINGNVLLPDGSAGAGIRVRIVQVNLGEPSAHYAPASLGPYNPLRLIATTDASGAFSIGDMPPGAIVGCDVDDDRYAQVGFDQTFKLPTDGSPATGTIRLQAAAELAGRVLRDGNPVAGIEVGAQSTAGDDFRGWPDAVTGADGRFLLTRMPAATYNVALKLRDVQQTEFTAVAHEAVSVRAGRKIEGLDFDLIPGAVIEGHLFDAAGKPIASGQIGVYGPAHPRSGAWVQTTFTDATGHYLMRVPEGEQYIYTMDQGEPGANKTLTLQDGTRTVLDLRL